MNDEQISVNTLADWADDFLTVYEEKLIEITYPPNGQGLDFFASIAAELLPGSDSTSNDDDCQQTLELYMLEDWDDT